MSSDDLVEPFTSRASLCTVEQVTNEMSDIKITKNILYGCIAIPNPLRKRFIWKGKPNPKPFYNFSNYTLKQLLHIKNQLDTPVYYDNLKERINSDKKMEQFLSDFKARLSQFTET